MTEQHKSLKPLVRALLYLSIITLVLINLLALEWFFSSERVRNRCLAPTRGASEGIAFQTYIYCLEKYPKLFTETK